jgi:hypothetical protein
MSLAKTRCMGALFLRRVGESLDCSQTAFLSSLKPDLPWDEIVLSHHPVQRLPAYDPLDIATLLRSESDPQSRDPVGSQIGTILPAKDAHPVARPS